MAEEVKKLVEFLREDAEWAQANEWETPITLGDNLTAAADMIEKLSADLESDERQYGRDAFETLVDECVKLDTDRDAWKLRAEAAERDMGRMIPCYTCKAQPLGKAPECDGCEAKPLNGWKRSHYSWRGPCGENGGAEDEGSQAD